VAGTSVAERPGWVTFDEAANMLGCSRQTVRRLARRARALRIRFFLGDRRAFVPRDDVAAYAVSGESRFESSGG
jgi:excisionase family DNA binding protein